MDSDCRKALQMLEENDPVLTELRVVDCKVCPQSRQFIPANLTLLIVTIMPD